MVVANSTDPKESDVDRPTPRQLDVSQLIDSGWVGLNWAYDVQHYVLFGVISGKFGFAMGDVGEARYDKARLPHSAIVYGALRMPHYSSGLSGSVCVLFPQKGWLRRILVLITKFSLSVTHPA